MYERAAKLHEAGVMSGKDWDGIEAQYEVAKAQKLAAEDGGTCKKGCPR